jgi:hypothetical protein
VGPCVDAPPPSVLVLSRPTDPSSCLSATARQRGVSVFIEVDAKGRPIAVGEVHDLCLVVGEDGRPLEKVPLDAQEKRCVLESLQAWRFGTFDTCARQGVGLDLPLQADLRAFNERERGDVMAVECRGRVLEPPSPKARSRCESAAVSLFGSLAVPPSPRSEASVTKPRILHRVNPRPPAKWPAACRHMGTLHEALIAPSGNVEQVFTLKAACPEFDRAASTAIRQWRYSPQLVDGKAVPVCMAVSTLFHPR